jgi:cellulose synthase (UDP-forming)
MDSVSGRFGMRSNNSHHLHGPTLTLLIILATLGALLYARFIYNPANAGDFIAYAIVVIAESIILVQALLSMWTILSGGFNPRDFEYNTAKRHLTGVTPEAHISRYTGLYLHRQRATVDVFITVYGEPINTVKRTVIAARDMLGSHETYVLDDGKSPAVAALAAQLGVKYVTRPSGEGAKAGNINHALRITNSEYFVVFDADFMARPNFLIETVPFFSKPQIAFVQTPQVYGNLHNMISRGAGYMQNVFYDLIQPGKNRFNAAFCVGTNVIFRRQAIDEIGGFYTASKSEDIWTSLLLHEAGFQSVYISDKLAVGDAPETTGTYFKQQLRWATGGFEILFGHNFFKSKLNFDQKLQYISTAAYYLNGLAILLLMTLPALHIFFNLSPVNLSVAFWVWLASYLLFYGLQVVVAFYSMGSFRLETIVVAMASFPIYLKALSNVIFHRKVSWQATGDAAQRNDPLNFVTAQIMIFTFLMFTTVAGFWKFYYTGVFSLSLVWNIINTAIFAIFLLAVRRERRLLKRRVRVHVARQNQERVFKLELGKV